jgi:hypothetical protein
LTNKRKRTIIDLSNEREENKMNKILEFERRETIIVDIDSLADLLDDKITDALIDHQGLTWDDIECIDYNKIKTEIAKKWLEEISKND